MLDALRNDPASIGNLTLEELVQSRIIATSEIDELDATKKAIDQELIAKMDEDSKIILGHKVLRINRTTLKVDLTLAKELGATKMEEKVDSIALNKLKKSGVELPSETYTFIQVKALESNEEE